MENCVKIKTDINSESRLKFLRFANVNARALKNKTAEIADHVLSNNINECTVTETWLKEADTVSIAALSPPGYLFKNFPRQSNRAGGGTGIMFNANFNVTLTMEAKNDHSNILSGI